MKDLFILIDKSDDWKPYFETESTTTVSEYLSVKYSDKKPKLIINLSNDYQYNSEGYYCSLLAQARKQKIIPSVETLNKLEAGIGLRLSMSMQKQCSQWIAKNNIVDHLWYLDIYFGTCNQAGLDKIARYIFDQYPCPMLRVTLNNNQKNQIESVKALSLNDLTEQQQDNFASALDQFSKHVWRLPRAERHTKYDLGILYEPDEKFPPSDKHAMHKFLEIAKKMDIRAELITENDAARLLEFDGLFIRTTTSLNHYTYNMSQRAASNGLTVIDDPESIIRCTNKVYLSELFRKNNIPAPESMLLYRSQKYDFEKVSSQIGHPFILKIPDGSFSVGMYKVENDEQLKDALESLFKHSAIILAQEFTPTEFDWRIGILDGNVLYACKYYMAKGHWQIYNHAVTGKNLCGAWETLPIYQVPSKIRDTAVKAAALIGKGLYGVDLKMVDGKPKVIEINDNPSIDHEVEDAILGDELYFRVLNYFLSHRNQ